ncbi:MAG: hypothetical protein EXX96DRAFT_474714, partial [Benjaminiella poitrasii]
IEELWSKIKKEVCKTPLVKNELIANRIEEAVQKVIHEDCQGWIRHSRRLFTKCINIKRM